MEVAGAAVAWVQGRPDRGPVGGVGGADRRGGQVEVAARSNSQPRAPSADFCIARQQLVAGAPSTGDAPPLVAFFLELKMEDGHEAPSAQLQCGEARRAPPR